MHALSTPPHRLPPLLLACACLVACDPKDSTPDTGDPPHTADTVDTTDTADTADQETGDPDDTGDASTLITPDGGTTGVAPGFGVIMASPGDVDGDGARDVVASSCGVDPAQISVWIWYGPLSTGRIDPDARFYLPPPTEEWDQATPAPLGDTNDDGLGDLSVVHWVTGITTVFTGSETRWGPDTAPTAVIRTDTDHFLNKSFPAGDVNGDSFDDLFVGNSTDEGSGLPSDLYLFAGPVTGDLALWDADVHLLGGETWAHSALGIGDIDGDGLGDVAVADWTDGQVFTGSAPDWMTLRTTYDLDWVTQVASAGDNDGDGYGDLFFGAYLFRGPPPPATLTVADADATLQDDAGGVAWVKAQTAGDVDGDGRDDVLTRGVFNVDEANVDVFLEPLQGAVLRATADLRVDEVGVDWIEATGDISGDGIDDFAVGDLEDAKVAFLFGDPGWQVR